ncbi:MAG: 30S ribosomal protein S11 [Patescibacteria group bacterium]
MGKKRIIKKWEAGGDSKSATLLKLPKRRLTTGVFNILSTYNNTLINLADEKGDVILASSSSAVGFRGSKKGTPYAATKVAESLGERAKLIGIKEVMVRVKGIGAGRESAIRAFAGMGFDIKSIRDVTPTPHNGPKLRKPRRV